MVKNKNFFNLKRKVVVITGACGLLGRNHVIAVASAGAYPILIDIDQKKLKKLQDEVIKKFEVECFALKTDITNEIQVKSACNLIMKKFGKIDGLINNAANNPKIEGKSKISFSRLENFNIKQWNDDLNVGLTGSFICSKFFGEKISKNKKGGVIIHISSDLGLIAPDQNLYVSKRNKVESVKPITYSVVKTGVIGLSRYLSTYWTKQNVRSNVICPGAISNNQSNEFLEKIKLKIPLGRLANQDEYQSTIIWMLSDNTSYLNGAVISIDGGRTAW